MKKTLPIFIFFALLSAACSQHSPSRNSQTTSEAQAHTAGTGAPYDKMLTVGGTTLHVQVASSSADMAEGLSDRASMDENNGMLFVFNTDETPGFWMPRMHFNLDMIWIKDGKIIGITKDVPAPNSKSGNLPLYYPPSPVNEVLEVNAGWSDTNEIKTGQDVRLK